MGQVWDLIKSTEHILKKLDSNDALQAAGSRMAARRA
jgi:hypothetical protein